jgi:hypothetical protein
MLVFLYLPYLAAEFIFLIFALLFLRKRVETFLPFGILFGIMSIIIGLTSSSILLSYSKIGILGIGTIFAVGILAILPLSIFKNHFARIISYLVSILMILILMIHPLFLIELSGGYSGDWGFIPFGIYISLLSGLFCIPFLLIKSRRARKDIDNLKKKL